MTTDDVAGIAFIMTIPTFVFFIDFIRGHSLQGAAVVFEILALVAGPLTLVALPSMSGLIQSEAPVSPRI